MSHLKRLPVAAFIALGIVGSALCSAAAQAQEPAGGQERHVLENGVTVLLRPVPGLAQVAVESFYEVGLVHEPAGMPQAAHLLEHLVCMAATANHEAGESMQQLATFGLANAETLPDWTHYDYMAPSERLEEILKIEAERLSSLRIDEAIIRQEGPRCAQEVDFVERSPQAGMGKFAFSALAQNWRHGRNVAHIREGLDRYDAGELNVFHVATYRPENLTLVIVGDFDPAEALEFARTHVGAVPERDAPTIDPIDWQKAPKRATVTWDSKVQAVCLAFPPPEDPTERAVLSLVGAMLQQRLAGDAALRGTVDALYTPNHLWPVGELPFFNYAAATPGADLEQVEALLMERVRTLVEHGGGIPPATFKALARQLASSSQALAEARVRQTARILARDGRTESQAIAMVLGQGAINWGVAVRFLGEDPEQVVADLEALTAERLAEIVRTNLAEDRLIVTRLVPEAAGE